MNIDATKTPLSEVNVDAIAVGVWQGEALTGPVAELDTATSGVITRMIDAEEISTERLSTTQLIGLPGVTARRILVIGLGDRDKVDARLSFRAGGVAGKNAGQ